MHSHLHNHMTLHFALCFIDSLCYVSIHNITNSPGDCYLLGSNTGEIYLLRREGDELLTDRLLPTTKPLASIRPKNVLVGKYFRFVTPPIRFIAPPIRFVTHLIDRRNQHTIPLELTHTLLI